MDNKEAKKGGVGMSEPQKKTNKGMGISLGISLGLSIGTTIGLVHG